MSTLFPPFFFFLQFTFPCSHPWLFLWVVSGPGRASSRKNQSSGRKQKLHFTLQCYRVWNKGRCCCSRGFETEQTPPGGVWQELYFYRKLGMVSNESWGRRGTASSDEQHADRNNTNKHHQRGFGRTKLPCPPHTCPTLCFHSVAVFGINQRVTWLSSNG